MLAREQVLFVELYIIISVMYPSCPILCFFSSFMALLGEELQP
jgi:hypothetical protein